MASSAAVPFSYLNLQFPVTRRRHIPSFAGKRANSCTITRASQLTDGGTSLLEAAKLTVDKYIKSGMVIGLGSGHASGMAIQYLGRQLRAGALKDIVGIPMSVASASEAAKAGIPLDYYQQDNSQIDFAFDDADIIEEGTLVAVIGRGKLQGEESIIQEKSILKAAHKLVFIIMERQYKGGLDGSVPVLVQSINWMETAEEIEDLFIGDAEVWRRPSIGHADPLGGDFPLVTREGHYVLDVIFTSPISDFAEVSESLDKIVGVVEHGVVSGIPCAAVIASQSGLRIVDNTAKREDCLSTFHLSDVIVDNTCLRNDDGRIVKWFIQKEDTIGTLWDAFDALFCERKSQGGGGK